MRQLRWLRGVPRIWREQLVPDLALSTVRFVYERLSVDSGNQLSLFIVHAHTELSLEYVCIRAIY